MPNINTDGQRREYTIQEAADRWNVSTRTVRRWIASGEVEAYRLGKRLIRVRMADIEALARPIPTVRHSR